MAGSCVNRDEPHLWRVSTPLTGEVRYAGPNGWVTQQFDQTIQFTTGNAVASVFVRFKGNPYGTAVKGTICW